MTISAVITVPFFAESPIPIGMAIAEVLGLGISDIILVQDRKGDSGTHTKAAADGVPQARILEVDESETTLRTRRGLQEAFKDASADVAFVFPGDIDPDHPPSGDNRKGWKRLVELAASDRLVMGDFHTNGRFKEDFDRELIGLAAIESMFPKEAQKIRELGLRKLRGEMYAAGRRAWDAYVGRGVPASMDLTTDLVLAAASDPALECLRVDLGEFHDNDAGRKNPLVPMMQIVRFVAFLALQRIRLEQSKNFGDRVAAYDELRGRIGQLFDRCVVAMTRYRHHIGSPSTSGAELFGETIFNQNQKIELSFDWSWFPGWSYVFDPLDRDLEGFEDRLRIRIRRGSNSLLDGLDWLVRGSWGEMVVRNYLLCRLPIYSYHVTWKDGVNIENLRLLDAEHESEFRSFLAGLPSTLSNGSPSLPRPSFDLGLADGQVLRFQFREFCIWGRSAFVARLKPADRETRHLLQAAEKKRAETIAEWATKYGLPSPKKDAETYVPHVSLGYFPNPDFAAPAEAELPSWSQAAARDLAGRTIEFNSASLYFFTSMAEFFKASPEASS